MQICQKHTHTERERPRPKDAASQRSLTCPACTSWLPVYKSIATAPHTDFANPALTAELNEIKLCIRRGRPFKVASLEMGWHCYRKKVFLLPCSMACNTKQAPADLHTHTQTLSLSVLLCRANSAEWRNDWKPPHRQTNCPTDWLTDGLTNLGICFCVTRQTLTVTVSVSVCFWVC